jgi:hypothetical protein
VRWHAQRAARRQSYSLTVVFSPHLLASRPSCTLSASTSTAPPPPLPPNSLPSCLWCACLPPRPPAQPAALAAACAPPSARRRGRRSLTLLFPLRSGTGLQTSWVAARMPHCSLTRAFASRRPCLGEQRRRLIRQSDETPHTGCDTCRVWQVGVSWPVSLQGGEGNGKGWRRGGGGGQAADWGTEAICVLAGWWACVSSAPRTNGRSQSCDIVARCCFGFFLVVTCLFKSKPATWSADPAQFSCRPSPLGRFPLSDQIHTLSRVLCRLLHSLCAASKLRLTARPVPPDADNSVSEPP